MVVNLSNELTAIKILDPSTADDDDDDDYRDNRHPTRDQIRKSFDTYFSESRPLSVKFFIEECRAMLDEEFRERRKLLHDKLKKSIGMASRKSLAKKMSRYSPASQRRASTSPLAPQSTVSTAAQTEDYHLTGRYGNLDRILFKIDHITRFVTEAMENGAYSLESLSLVGYFTINHRKLIEDFNLQKMELAVIHRSVVKIVDELVQIHQSVTQIGERIAQESNKRYRSEEIYSDDGSTIIVNNNEKRYVFELNSKIDNFLEQKTELVQILEKITTFLRSYIAHKNELDAEIMEYDSTYLPFRYTGIAEHELSTIAKDSVIVNKAELERNIQSCKIFKKFL